MSVSLASGAKFTRSRRPSSAGWARKARICCESSCALRGDDSHRRNGGDRPREGCDRSKTAVAQQAADSVAQGCAIRPYALEGPRQTEIRRDVAHRLPDARLQLAKPLQLAPRVAVAGEAAVDPFAILVLQRAV